MKPGDKTSGFFFWGYSMEVIVQPGVVTTRFEIENDSFKVIRSQDVESILEANKEQQNDSAFRNGWSESGDMKHVASIPLVIVEEWCKEAGIPKKEIFGRRMQEVIRKKLNDPENKFLRTGLGEIGAR